MTVLEFHPNKKTFGEGKMRHEEWIASSKHGGTAPEPEFGVFAGKFDGALLHDELLSAGVRVRTVESDPEGKWFRVILESDEDQQVTLAKKTVKDHAP